MTPPTTLASAQARVAHHRAEARRRPEGLDRTYHRRAACRIYLEIVRWLRRPLP